MKVRDVKGCVQGHTNIERQSQDLSDTRDWSFLSTHTYITPTVVDPYEQQNMLEKRKECEKKADKNLSDLGLNEEPILHISVAS